VKRHKQSIEEHVSGKLTPLIVLPFDGGTYLVPLGWVGYNAF
jgi:hypothetical protein